MEIRFETSAKDNLGIEKGMKKLIDTILSEFGYAECNNDSDPNVIKLSNSNSKNISTPRPRGGCCGSQPIENYT